MEHKWNAISLQQALEQEDFTSLYQKADALRQKTKGDVIDIRGILEFSNYCRRRCVYCGLNSQNKSLPRYRMTLEEIAQAAQEAAEAGYRTLVLQSGEDPYYTPDRLVQMVKSVKATGMSVTMSVGELPYETLARLREAGADRYLLKHETADPNLYASLHPCGTFEARIRCLRDIKALGFETGSGFMIGLPNQTAATIAKDLLLLKELSCDMAGIGPFLPHPETPLAHQPPGSGELTKRAVALARLLLPDCNLPATTSLGVLDGQEKRDVFSCGANVIMRKVTPLSYRAYYEIYPSQQLTLGVREGRIELEQQIREMGRIPR